MNLFSRRSFVLSAVLVTGLVLLGRWVMRNEDAAAVSPTPVAVPSAPPVQAQPAAAVETISKVESPELEVAPEGVPLLPRAPTLRGRVYDEDSGAPIGDARIAVNPRKFDAAGSTPESLSTSVDGTFVIEHIVPGTVHLRVDAQGYAFRNVEVDAGKAPAPVEIGLIPGGTIMGRLFASDGATPVAGMMMMGNRDLGFGTGSSTGPTGEFEFHDLPPGRYQLMAHAAGGMAEREVLLARGQRIAGIVVVLTAGHSIRGVVSGLRPEELGHTTLWLSRDGAAGGATDVRVDERGAFVIPGVPPGRVQLGVDTQRRQVVKAVEMPPDSDLTVNLDFPHGVRLSGRITRGGEPFPNVHVLPMPSDGAQQPASVTGNPTSVDGAYVIEDVPLGKYTLMILLRNPIHSDPIEISGDTVFDFDVPAGQLVGRVFESGGEPIMGAEVFIWPVEPVEMQRPRPFSSMNDGTFILGELEPGEFMLTVYKTGYELHRKRISFDTNSKELTIRLREEPGIEVTAHEAGRPLRQLIAAEVLGTARGTLLRLELDDEGMGRLPSALAGSTLRFIAPGCEPTVIEAWSGTKLELQFERSAAR
jgi:hypothetical protein